MYDMDALLNIIDVYDMNVLDATYKVYQDAWPTQPHISRNISTSHSRIIHILLAHRIWVITCHIDTQSRRYHINIWANICHINTELNQVATTPLVHMK